MFIAVGHLSKASFYKKTLAEIAKGEHQDINHSAKPRADGVRRRPGRSHSSGFRIYSAFSWALVKQNPPTNAHGPTGRPPAEPSAATPEQLGFYFSLLPSPLWCRDAGRAGGKEVRDRRGLFWLRRRGRAAGTVAFGLRERVRALSRRAGAWVAPVSACDRPCGFGAARLRCGRVCLRACPVSASTVKGSAEAIS